MKSNEFRNKLGQCLKRLRESDEPTVVDHYNIPVAVLVSTEWYSRAVAAVAAVGDPAHAKAE